MSAGNIVQVIGAVVDVEFSRESLPKVYDSLTIDGSELILEVQQQLGDGVVRCIAMGAAEGINNELSGFIHIRRDRPMQIEHHSVHYNDIKAYAHLQGIK